jgi:hypothetical protein
MKLFKEESPLKHIPIQTLLSPHSISCGAFCLLGLHFGDII